MTKYNPAFRNDQGHYLRDEWTFFGQIGEKFNGITFTFADYQHVEDAYVLSAIKFLEESGGAALWATDIQNSNEFSLPFARDKILQEAELIQAFRDVLQEKYWCRFADEQGRFVHFGWDYYMYIGVSIACEKAVAYAQSVGLFVEPFKSPYLPGRR